MMPSAAAPSRRSMSSAEATASDAISRTRRRAHPGGRRATSTTRFCSVVRERRDRAARRAPRRLLVERHLEAARGSLEARPTDEHQTRAGVPRGLQPLHARPARARPRRQPARRRRRAPRDPRARRRALRRRRVLHVAERMPLGAERPGEARAIAARCGLRAAARRCAAPPCRAATSATVEQLRRRCASMPTIGQSALLSVARAGSGVRPPARRTRARELVDRGDSASSQRARRRALGHARRARAAPERRCSRRVASSISVKVTPSAYTSARTVRGVPSKSSGAA